MNVTVNNKVTAWLNGQTKDVKDTFNTKCTEVINNDLSTWRDVGKSNYDYRVSGDYRCVSTKSGVNFNVAAIYRHGSSGGKELVTGQTVTGY